MKLYVLPVPARLQPRSQPFKYPAHNTDYGVEQDFYDFLRPRGDCLTDSPQSAAWHYLPVFWTRWHLNHDYGKRGREELQADVNNILIDDAKTFTICQYDDGPCVALGKATIFLASRRTEEGFDIPLLSKQHRKPLLPVRKKFAASFAGRLATHPLRQRMWEALRHRSDVEIVDGDRGSRFFVRQLMASHAALAPRGYGGSSFRFYESLQLGVLPILIGDHDTRPFKKYIDWDRYSYFVQEPRGLPDLLDSFDRAKTDTMGREGASLFRERLTYGKWCDLVLRQLQEMG